MLFRSIAPVSQKLLKTSHPQQQAEIRKFKRIFKYLGIEHYVVYLDGICQDSTYLKPYAQNFLSELYQSLPPEIRIVGNIMPYSVTNRPLTDPERPLSAFWRWVEASPENGHGALMSLINLRNLFKIVVSADNRYGPIFNQG